MAPHEKAHKTLARLVGTWRGEERIHPGPDDPDGGAAIGRAIHQLALGGLAMVQDYEQRRGGTVALQHHGIFTWDPAEGRFRLHEFGSNEPSPQVFSGDMFGEVLVLNASDGSNGRRATYDLSQPGRIKFKLELGAGDVWRPHLEATYTRKD